MRYAPFALIILLALLSADDLQARSREKERAEVLSNSRGFYKEVFMDGGIGLTSRRKLPAAPFLGLTMEFFASAKEEKLSERDTLLQNDIFAGCEEDTNGRLLYPDGAPRFRMIYVNGGRATKHSKSLGENGLSRLREYVANGGSYLGTCAGAFFASSGSVNDKGALYNTDKYLCIWPSYTHSTHLKKSRPTLRLEKGSPLSKYFDFGKARLVEEVYHNGGCYAHVDASHLLPTGSEPLARYIFDNTDKVIINNEIAIWAHKHSERHGRAILCGSHPENVSEGERLELMAAMMLYAMEGNPKPQIKGSLKSGKIREMDKRTEDNNPAFTRIGDRQYHHFRIDIPKGCKRLKIEIDGYENGNKFDLTLCAKRGEMAFHDNTSLKSVGNGCKRTLTVDNPKSGTWFVSVFCETTVETNTDNYGTHYHDNLEVLNGVPYKVCAEWK